MKRLVILFLILFAYLAYSYTLSADMVVRVGIYDNEPLIFIDPDGTGKGFFADIIEHIAAVEKWRIEYVPGSWNQGLSRLENNQIDLLCTIAYSKKRDQIFDFTKENLLTNWGELYTFRDSDIKSVTDLAGKKVALLKGDIHNAIFNQITRKFDIQFQAVETDNYHAVLDMVSRKRVDAGVVNRFFGMKYASKYQVAKSGVIFNPIKIHYAVADGKNKALITAIDRHIKLLKGDDGSIYYRSLDKWLGVVTPRQLFPPWAKWTLISALGLVVLLFLGNIILRFQVKAKTADLKESEKRYRALFETMIQGVIYQDAEGNIVSANPAAEMILGLTLDQMQGKASIDSRWRSVHQDGSDFPGETHPSMMALRKGEKIENTTMGIFNPSTGDHTWININAVPLFKEGEDKPHQVYTTFHDITDRNKAIEALQESEERYRILFELSPDAIVIWQDEKVVHANSAAMTIFGATTQDQLVGIPMWKIHHPDYHTRLNERYQSVFTSDCKLPPAEYQLVRMDGRIIHVEASATSIQYRNQPACLSVYRDMTERKLLEIEKVKLETRLQQAQKMESIGTLAGGIAHDFNNILSAIIGYSEIAISAADRDSGIYHSLCEILKAGDRAKNLVNQILTFSRQTDQELKPVQVRIITKESLKLLRASLPAMIEIRSHLQSHSTIMADPTQIHQIVMNLCTNAFYAMREKGGLLEVRLEDIKLDRQEAEKHPELGGGSYIQLTVADTGLGMEPQVLERIFDPFFTTKEKGEGTGLGLSVVHGIVKSGGGSIFVHSEPGKGTCFEILFPIIETIPDTVDMTVETMANGTEKVLFIDDEKPIAELTKQQLESLGYDVTARTSPIEALELFELQSDKFDLVITDMTMPKMSGKELAEKLLRIRPDMPIILCTGFSRNIDEHQAALLGIKAMVFKPILKRDIAQKIREVLDNKEPLSRNSECRSPGASRSKTEFPLAGATGCSSI